MTLWWWWLVLEGLFSQTLAWYRPCNDSKWGQCNLVQKRLTSTLRQWAALNDPAEAVRGGMGWGRWVPCFPLSGNPETPCSPHHRVGQSPPEPWRPPTGRRAVQNGRWSIQVVKPKSFSQTVWWQLQADLPGTSRHLTAGIPSQGRQSMEERLMPLCNKMSATTAQVLWPFLEYCVQCTACMPSSNPYSSPVRGNWGCLKLTVVLLTINTSLTWSHYTN